MTTSQSSSSGATLAAIVLVTALGTAALYRVTLGWRVVATEDGRRLQIREHPVLLPRARLTMPIDSDLRDNLRSDGRVAIVTFFYSQCNAVCSVLGSQYQQLQAALLARRLEHRVRLISVSFDPRDTPAVLAGYAQRHKAETRVWQLASVPDGRERRALLAAFGIVVLPAPLGEFQHNAAFHIVDSAGRLVRIVDLEEQDAALETAIALAAARHRS